MIHYIVHTAGLGDSTIFSRLRDASGNYYNWVNFTWDASESVNTKLYLSERATIGEATESLYIVMSSSVSGSYVREIMNGTIRLGYDDIYSDSQPVLSDIEGSTVLAKEATVSSIPTNPVLTDDVRLNALSNLDSTVSSIPTATLTEIEGSTVIAKEATSDSIVEKCDAIGKQSLMQNLWSPGLWLSDYSPSISWQQTDNRVYYTETSQTFDLDTFENGVTEILIDNGTSRFNNQLVIVYKDESTYFLARNLDYRTGRFRVENKTGNGSHTGWKVSHQWDYAKPLQMSSDTIGWNETTKTYYVVSRTYIGKWLPWSGWVKNPALLPGTGYSSNAIFLDWAGFSTNYMTGTVGELTINYMVEDQEWRSFVLYGIGTGLLGLTQFWISKDKTRLIPANGYFDGTYGYMTHEDVLETDASLLTPQAIWSYATRTLTTGETPYVSYIGGASNVFSKIKGSFTGSIDFYARQLSEHLDDTPAIKVCRLSSNNVMSDTTNLALDGVELIMKLNSFEALTECIINLYVAESNTNIHIYIPAGLTETGMTNLYSPTIDGKLLRNRLTISSPYAVKQAETITTISNSLASEGSVIIAG